MKSTSNRHQSQIEGIYKDYKEAVYNYIYRLCNDPDQAQDVTQQTFVKLMIHPELEQINNIKSYLFTIARNHLYDSWKKKKETLLGDDLTNTILIVEEAELTNVLNDEPTNEAATQQLQQAVLFSIQRLSDKYRELMILRYMQDLTIKEIVSITHLSNSDIKVSLLRARKQFDQELTQHMYLKIAKSRQQCDEISAMLAPYSDNDIPDGELKSFAKHIDQCSICSEDANELKRTRKLLALIPFISVPLALDSSFNDAMAASTTPAAPVPDAGSISKALLTKVAASTVVLAVIVSSIILLDNKASNSFTDDQSAVTQQNVNAVATTPTQVASTDAVSLTAKIRLTSGSPPVKALWIVSQLNPGNSIDKDMPYVTNALELDRNLKPGHYKIQAKFGHVDAEQIIQLETDKPVSLDMIADAGMVNISTQLLSKVRISSSNLIYLIFKSREDLENNNAFVTASFQAPATKFTLPAGDYIVKARHSGFGDIEAIQNITIKPGKNIDINIPLSIGIFKPEVFLSEKNLQHNPLVRWSMHKNHEQKNYTNSIITMKNGDERTMESGDYNLTLELGNIKQQIKITIKDKEITSPRIILNGGFVSATAWTDKSKTTINNKVYFDFSKQQTDPSIYKQRLEQTQSKQDAIDVILPVGKFDITAQFNDKDNPVKITRAITVNDGDDTHIDFIIPNI